jgi:hypothetical protein
MAEPTLVGANITFHTNDEDKDNDTLVFVSVQKGTTVAAEIKDRFQHFSDHSDAGPFDLLMVNPLTRDQLKTGNMTIGITPMVTIPGVSIFFLIYVFRMARTCSLEPVAFN